MRWRRMGAIMLRQFYILRGSFSRVLPLFTWVGIDIVLWGFISRYLNSVATPGFNFVPRLLGAVLLWDFLSRVMQGVTMAFFEDVWSRNFLNVFATPITVGEYVAGLVAWSVLTSAIGLIVMMGVATVVFGLSFASYGWTLLPYLMILFLFGIALGIFASAAVLRLGPAAEWFVWPIPAVLSPFAGVFYPLATLPAWMRGIGRLIPASYVFEGMRGALSGRGASAMLLGWGLVLSIAYVLLASLFFSAVFRYAVRTGLMARYSAESVS